jgi:predicted dehydrogenase
MSLVPFSEAPLLPRPLRWGMVGGGKGSQIGYSHRDAAKRDGLFSLQAGAFDIDPARGQAFGQSLGLAAERCYADYRALLAGEAQRSDGIEVLSITTPNNSHYEICHAALTAGLHVVCEKPLALEEKQALELEALAKSKDRVLAVMYGYTGYEMVQQAKSMVESGTLGAVRIVQMQFAHGWHATEVEANDPGAKWRVTPAVSGPTYVLGDIGTHCFQMGAFISGLEVESLCCMRSSFIPSRAPLEDNAHVMLRYKGKQAGVTPAVGTLWASAVNVGSPHSFKVRVVGEKGSIEWWDEQPNQLQVGLIGQPAMVYERGHGHLDASARFERVGGGHPAGYFDSWANLYRRFAWAMAGQKEPQDAAGSTELYYPQARDGVLGVRFVERCAESADTGSQWVAF